VRLVVMPTPFQFGPAKQPRQITVEPKDGKYAILLERDNFSASDEGVAPKEP
jgi:hypothetical protein